MSRIVRVGSIVVIDDLKYMILGCNMIPYENKMRQAYFVTRYPRGLSGEDSYRICLAEKVTRVLYESKVGENAEKLYEKIGESFEKIDGIEVEKYNKIQKLLESNMGGNSND